MKFKFPAIISCILLLIACKSSPPVSGRSSVSGKPMSDIEKAEVLNLFYNANKEKILGNLNNAAELFSEVIRKDAGNHAAMYELANIYAEQKKFTDALFFIKNAYKADSKNLWYALSLSEIYEKNKKFNEAAQVLEQLVKDYPDRVDFYFEWATAYILSDRPAEAIRVYDKLEEKIGITKEVTVQKSRLYQRTGKNEKAIAELQKLIAMDPKDAQAYGMLAEVYQNMGEKQKALDTFNKVLEVDPNNPFIHLSLAEYYRANGDKDRSLQELKFAFSNKDLDVETKVNIVNSYFTLLELHPELKDQAMELCRLMLEAHPNEPRAHAVYGEFLLVDSMYSKARDEYREAKKLGADEFAVVERILRLDAFLQSWDTLILESEDALTTFPDHPLVYYFNSVANIQKKKYADAVKSLNTGVKLIVDDKKLEADFYSMLGECYHEMKDFTKSDESYDKALEKDPKAQTTLNNYAYYLSLRGERLERAEEMSRLSIEITPNSPTFEDTYGWIMFKQGKYNDAKIWIEKALEHEKSDSSAAVLEHYGDILYKTGETQKALEYWQKAKQAGEGASEFIDRKILEKKLPN